MTDNGELKRPAFGIDIDGVLSDVDVMLDELAIQYTGKPWPLEFAAAPSSTTELIPDHLLQQIFDDFHESRIPLLVLGQLRPIGVEADRPAEEVLHQLRRGLRPARRQD